MPSSLSVRRIVRVVALTTTALVACSGSYLVSQGDAGPTGVDAGPVPTTTATSPQDAARPQPDSAIADAAPPSPCLGSSLFCDDFDDPTQTLNGRWMSVNSAAGTFDYDDTTFVSPGRALRLRLTPVAGTSSASISKDLDVPSGSFRVTLELRFDLPEAGTFGEIDPLTVRIAPFATGVRSQQIALAMYSSAIQLETYRGLMDGGTATSSSRVDASLGGTYHPVSLTVRSANGQATCTLEIDAKVVATETFPAPVLNRMSFSVGAPYVSDINAPLPLRFDNVKVEAL